MFALYLNPVTARAEKYIPVAITDTKERLEKFLMDEKCERHNDGQYTRFFKEGLLHNYNPPYRNGRNSFGVLEGIVKVISKEELQRRHEEEIRSWELHFSTASRLD